MKSKNHGMLLGIFIGLLLSSWIFSQDYFTGSRSLIEYFSYYWFSFLLLILLMGVMGFGIGHGFEEKKEKK